MDPRGGHSAEPPGHDMQLKDIFTKEELAKLPRWASLPPRKGVKS